MLEHELKWGSGGLLFGIVVAVLLLIVVFRLDTVFGGRMKQERRQRPSGPRRVLIHDEQNEEQEPEPAQSPHRR